MVFDMEMFLKPVSQIPAHMVLQPLGILTYGKMEFLRVLQGNKLKNLYFRLQNVSMCLVVIIIIVESHSRISFGKVPILRAITIFTHLLFLLIIYLFIRQFVNS